MKRNRRHQKLVIHQPSMDSLCYPFTCAKIVVVARRFFLERSLARTVDTPVASFGQASERARQRAARASWPCRWAALTVVVARSTLPFLGGFVAREVELQPSRTELVKCPYCGGATSAQIPAKPSNRSDEEVAARPDLGRTRVNHTHSICDKCQKRFAVSIDSSSSGFSVHQNALDQVANLFASIESAVDSIGAENRERMVKIAELEDRRNRSLIELYKVDPTHPYIEDFFVEWSAAESAKRRAERLPTRLAFFGVASTLLAAVSTLAGSGSWIVATVVAAGGAFLLVAALAWSFHRQSALKMDFDAIDLTRRLMEHTGE